MTHGLRIHLGGRYHLFFLLVTWYADLCCSNSYSRMQCSRRPIEKQNGRVDKVPNSAGHSRDIGARMNAHLMNTVGT